MRAVERLIDLVLISIGFLGALFIYNALFQGGLPPEEMALGSGVSILAFWAAVESRRGADSASAGLWITFIEQFCLGTGVNLLLHSVLSYAFYIRRTPFLISAGGLISAALVSACWKFMLLRERSARRFLMVGFDTVAQKVFQFMHERPVGVLTSQPQLVPAGTPCLGGLGDAERVIREQRPTNIVVSRKAWKENLSPAVLLSCRLSGAVIEESPALYERFFSRVCCEQLYPADLLLSSALRGDSRTIAIQSIYTNLIGLALLLALLPVILLVGLTIWLFCGRGPIFESTECAGFQYIPFRLLQFRTTDGAGTPTKIGTWIRRLRLSNLPQLVNVVRGDMAIVGPKPVRSEFADYLTRLMPFYSHRFSVRPGMLGWAQTHAPRHTPPDDCRQIEYDLFYVKTGSLWMDIEIMLGSIFPGRSANA